MKKIPKPATGTFLRIPLGDGTFAYGRALSYPYVAFYNHRTAEASSDLDEIRSKPVVFTLAVRSLGIERWTAIGKKPLEAELVKPVVQFMQDLADFRECIIFDTAGFRKEVGPEECIGLERASVWDAHRVELRLLDTFLGRPNDEEIRQRVRLE
jgi:immunity protein 26 of polymorphic toxin system